MDTNATNRTTNYGLPLFIGTDKPAWLVDWNNTMTELDTKLKEIADAGDNSAILAILGDENSGLIKRVNDLAGNVASLMDTVNNETTGLVKRMIDVEGELSDTIVPDLNTQNACILNLLARVHNIEDPQHPVPVPELPDPLPTPINP